jgi:hypothetical protein
LFRGLGSKLMLAADLAMPAAEVRSSFDKKAPQSSGALLLLLVSVLDDMGQHKRNYDD